MKHDDATALVLSMSYDGDLLLAAILQELMEPAADPAEEKA